METTSFRSYWKGIHSVLNVFLNFGTKGLQVGSEDFRKVCSSDILSLVASLAIQGGPHRRSKPKEVPVYRYILHKKHQLIIHHFFLILKKSLTSFFSFFSLNVMYCITFVTCRSFIWHSWVRSVDTTWGKITFSTYIIYLLSEVIILSQYSTNQGTHSQCSKSWHIFNWSHFILKSNYRALLLSVLSWILE